MTFVRKALVYLLALVLLLALLGMAVTTAAVWGFSKPGRVETWLSQSNVYAQVPSIVIQNAPSLVSATIAGQAVAIPLNQTTLNAAAAASFSPQLVQTNVSQFLTANYSWLEGKTSTPNFRIDLTGAETSFGQNIAQLLETRLSSLPACTAAQLKQIGSSFNIATAPCLPADTDLPAISSQIGQQVTSETNLPNNGVLTADSLSNNGNSKPYYQTAHQLPRLYQLAVKLPWIFGGLAALCAIAIFFIAPRKRYGIRRLIWVLIEAGIILVLTRVGAYLIFHNHRLSAFSSPSTSNAQLAATLNNLVRRVVVDLTTMNMWFGLAYLVLAVLLFLLLIKTRLPKTARPVDLDPPLSNKRLEPAAPSTTPLPSANTYKKPTPPKRPRLIQ
jgi:hypothetical protein